MENLRYLMGAYFHEDWHCFQDSWQEVVDAFLTDDTNTVRSVPHEIDTLLAGSRTLAELEDEMDAMGCSYLPAEGYREWLGAVRDRILNVTPGSS